MSIPSIPVELDSALNAVNQSFKNEPYEVVIRKGSKVQERQPVMLDLYHPKENRYERIGATHLFKLLPDCENLPFQKISRTVDELKDSIFNAVNRHFEAKEKGEAEVLISPSGTIYYKNGNNFTLENGIFVIDGVQVKWDNKPLEAIYLVAEDIITLKKLENGNYEFSNSIDQREGKGMLVSMPDGNIYRV